MKITIVAVGKLKGKYLKEGISEYSKRLSRFCELQIIEVEDEQAPENLSVSQEEQVKRREAERIIKRVKEGSVLIVLDLKGKKLSSEEFSDKLNSFFISGKSHITFVIGGSLGLDEELVRKADFSLSLSDMTFPHQLARLILVEQIFRAFKILNNEP
ncbi:23S rRNA (pseudouridine(1915)-N(3))-methyltransferase RlmH [Acetivibrio clariflavus]|uniref:23S rRNA (pseudouridine(1915)-N(3))-methyltransferase RlmH n=1 Tax=Acetivibrio clariflavus TaxID=288965 RepID=UPI00048992BF|nr:23S rRNA (pseudouridine(1915)-N(3))-methyltransferase RlmH [Acetivibrio clariflavus]